MSELLTVDWTACRARGVCSELLPERIALDEWGYPLVDPAPLDTHTTAYARRAVAACPTRALRLQHAAGVANPRVRPPTTPALRPVRTTAPGEP